MSLELRKRTYAQFAQEANAAGVSWIVLHGIEGYPANIGRDLDVQARDKDHAARLLEIFVSVLRRHEFERIVVPGPTWGRRMLGITGEYNVVELHILDRVRVANVDFRPNWRNVEYVENTFPIEPLVTYGKACMLPAIVGDEAWRRKAQDMPVPASVPWWLRPASSQLQAGRAITAPSKLAMAGGYLAAHPFASVGNAFRWFRTKLMSHFEPTTPVYALPNWIAPKAFEDLVKSRLGELFLGVTCVDDLSKWEIAGRQSSQRLVYVTTARKPDGLDTTMISPEQLDTEELLEFLVSSFCEFNERWRT